MVLCCLKELNLGQSLLGSDDFENYQWRDSNTVSNAKFFYNGHIWGRTARTKATLSTSLLSWSSGTAKCIWPFYTEQVSCVGLTGKDLRVSCVDIKRKVSTSMLGSALELSAVKIIFCDIDGGTSRMYISAEKKSHLVQQATVLQTNFVFWTVAFETKILYAVLARITATHWHAALHLLFNVVGPLLRWAYESGLVLQPFVIFDDIEIVESGLYFWKRFDWEVKSFDSFFLSEGFQALNAKLVYQKKV